MPETDLLVWTPNCQPYSAAGENVGLDDGVNGGALAQGLKRVVNHEPNAHVFECTAGLMRKPHKSVFKQLLTILSKRFRTSWKVLNSCEICDVGHDRRRVFVVGVHKRNRNFKRFEWPRKRTIRAKASTTVLRNVPKGIRPCLLPTHKCEN